MLLAVPLRLHNTLSRREEEFVPLEKGKVRMYTCGPTVYGRPHIGNYASFLMADLLRRWLEVSGYEVLHVKNITDVGHIVADADSGEDKVEAQAKREHRDPLEIARTYEAEFLEDERALHILEPLARPRATETIPEMIAMIRQLLKEGHAYETNDGMYFSIESFPEYGTLSGNTLANLGKLMESVRIEVKESKKHPADFALWKKCVGENAQHVLRWSFETGARLTGVGEDPRAGFPGWHIECSAMSTKFLGEQIDIHTGGEDNIFPHHECEIAQSEGAFGTLFVRYWVHRRRVNFETEKMSKSLGNVLTLPEILAREFHPLDLRYYLLGSHYRSHMTFSWKGLTDAKKARLKVTEWIEEMRGIEGKVGSSFAPSERLGRAGKASEDEKVRTAGGNVEDGNESSVEEFERRFKGAMDSDLNTPDALAAVFDCMAFTRSRNFQLSTFNFQLLRDFIAKVRHTFGCFEPEAFAVPPEVQKLVSEREEARRGGDYVRSDALRKEALKRGFVLEDVEDGTKIVPRGRRG